MDKNEQFEKNLLILEKLANGINPIDDTPFPTDSPINNVDVTRAIFFALTQLKHPPKKTQKKKYFYIEEDALATFEFIPEGAYLTQLVEKLNSLIDVNRVKKLSRKKVIDWLIDLDILTTVQTEGKKSKRHMPTEKGLNMGLEVVRLLDRFGTPFDAVKYSLSMQKFIIDNIDGLYNWIANRRR